MRCVSFAKHRPYFDQIFNILVDSPAESSSLEPTSKYDTYPPFFKEHIMPYHKNLRMLTPKEASLPLRWEQGLLDLLPETGMDIAESFCPQPMTEVTVSDAKGLQG
jgi:hypothetical protein